MAMLLELEEFQTKFALERLDILILTSQIMDIHTS